MSEHAAEIGNESVSRDEARTVVSIRAFVVAAIGAVVGAEALIAFVDPLLGVGLDALIIAVLAWHRYIFAPTGKRAPSPALGVAAIALALLPIERILSLTMPAKKLVEIAWYELIGAPILAVLVVLCRIDPDLGRLARNRGRLGVQGAVAAAGIPLGLVGFLIARQPLPDAGPPALEYVVGPLILIVFTGLTEELLFRGALAVALERVGGKWLSIIATTLLFAAFHLDGGSLAFVPFAAAYGLAFALVVRWTGSLTGVVVAHGLLNVGMIILWPHLL